MEEERPPPSSAFISVTWPAKIQRHADDREPYRHSRRPSSLLYKHCPRSTATATSSSITTTHLLLQLVELGHEAEQQLSAARHGGGCARGRLEALHE